MGQRFSIDRRTGQEAENGERYYLVFQGLSRARAETLVALVYEMNGAEGARPVTRISGETWAKIERSMEMIGDAPALRLPGGATESAAADALGKLEDRYMYLASEAPGILELLSQRHDLQ